MKAICWTAISATAAGAFAQQATFQQLRQTDWPFESIGRTAIMSGDGKTVTDGRWRWTQDEGFRPTGFLPDIGIDPHSLERIPTCLSFNGEREIGRTLALWTNPPTEANMSYSMSDGSTVFPIFSPGAPVLRSARLVIGEYQYGPVLCDDDAWLTGYRDPSTGRLARKKADGQVEVFPPAPDPVSFCGRPSRDGSVIPAANGYWALTPGSAASEAVFLYTRPTIAPYGVTSDGAHLFGGSEIVAPTYSGACISDRTSLDLDYFNPPIGFDRRQPSLPWMVLFSLSNDGSVAGGVVTRTKYGRDIAFVRRRGEQARTLRDVFRRFGRLETEYYEFEDFLQCSEDGKTLLVWTTSPWYGSAAAIVSIPHWSPCPADINFDGFVDDADFVLFACAYDELATTDADLTLDEQTDDSDFVVFAVAYDALICP